MRVFLGEYVCGGGFLSSPLDEIPASLRSEGRAMLTAITQDFAAVVDTVHVAVDPRFELEVPANVVCHPMVDDQPLWSQWIAAARDCDRSMVIAPESEGILAQGVAMLHAAGLNMINGFGDFLRCVSDKWETARKFAIAGVPHPPTWTLNNLPSEDLPSASRWVVKPRDGCGTDNVSVYDSFASAVEAARGSEHLIQPWIEGRAISVAVIVEGNEITALPAVNQEITAEDVSYRGGCGPLTAAEQDRATSLAQSAIISLPRTVRGYIGLDIVLADNQDEDCVIEVNPRLTTSYVGLRHIVEGNLAARLLGIDRSPVKCRVPTGRVCWDANGDVWENESCAS